MAAVDRVRNLCRHVKRVLEEWEDARSGRDSVSAVQGLANAAIAVGYLKPGPSSSGGGEAGARWREGEGRLKAQLEVTLWEQRVESQRTLDDRVAAMDTAATELRDALATLQNADDAEKHAGFQAISPQYLAELLSEIAGALEEETALCKRLLLAAGQGQGEQREQHILLSSAWTARPCVPEARLKALKEAVALELAS